MAAELTPHAPVSVIINRVHMEVTCPCGTIFAAFLTPDAGVHVHACAGCGTRHSLAVTSGPGEDGILIRADVTATADPAVPEPLTPDQARRARWRRSLRGGPGGEDG